MAITSLPPGFRFHPTDVELVKYYLKRKVMGKKHACDVIAEVDIYKNEPWDLPDKSFLKTRDLKWYFFCPREKKYTSGGRLKRSTDRGYWKTTGKDRHVLYNGKGVGMIKTLVYHQGRAQHGDRTNWVMHEYRMEDKDLADDVVQDAFVLCIIFRKEGSGPRNGAEYGAPFKEDEWSDNEEVNCGGQALCAAQPEPPLSVVPGSQSNSVVTAMPVSESTCSASASIPGQPETIPSAKELPPVAENDDVLTRDASQVLEHDDILSMLDLFAEDPIGNHKIEMLENSNRDRNMEGAARSDRDDLFDGLGDLENWYGLEGGVPFTSCDITPDDYSLDQMFTADDVPFIELTDLETPLSNRSKASSSRYNATYPSVTHQHKLPGYDHSPHGVFTDHSKAGSSRYSSTNPSVTPQNKLPGFDHSHGVVTEHVLPSFDQSPHPGVATQRDLPMFTQSPQPSGLAAHHAFPGFVRSNHHNPPAYPESPCEATQNIYSGFFAHSPELMRRGYSSQDGSFTGTGLRFSGPK